ncbi:L-lactate dehydrogenase [Acidaminobacter sp. JC074]|uniref:L-lactate dehydrogenase n=1 Tax=Acidaminobacter sp. JC074 TaxID=2530199 RepID=UPI001F0D4347|nr:L-lactate dehydrogenase [Acidaminobacter sp. JC074]MCH4889007.1 L-lactate dehydrogenase [Acidaminobacter sp. JC074]
MKSHTNNKVVIIGAGYVGSTTAYTLMQSGLVSEIALIDLDIKKAEGEVMDLNHCLSFTKPMTIKVGTYEDCKDADLIIMTAGPSIQPGGTRLDLAKQNSQIMTSIMKEIVKYTREAIILVATNPVDILTQVAVESVDYNPKKVLGSGTVLDSARFRYLLSQHCKVDARNVHGYILGEHGDSEVAAWSLTNIAGSPLESYCDNCNSNACHGLDKEGILNQVIHAGYHIIDRKVATYYGVSTAIKRITEAILRNEHSILTVSSLLNGEYGIDKIAMSVPTIVSSEGIHKIVELNLTDEESKLLKKSGDKLQEILNYIK